MPLTLVETQSLIVALGINVPPDILAQKAKAEEFKKRREKATADAVGKPADWWLKGKFDDVLKRADDSAEQKQFDPALKLLDDAGQILLQPDISPEVLAALQELAERQAALESEIARVQAGESPIGGDLKSGLEAVAQALRERDTDGAAARLGELEEMVRAFEQQQAKAAAAEGSAGTVEAALEGWQAARSVAVDQLKKLADAIKGFDDPRAVEGFILVRAIQANLTPKPESAQAVTELEQYLNSDSIILAAEAPNGFGIAIDLRKPLLNALGKLKPLLAA